MKGVLLMAYGTPASIAEVEAYYTHIRGGRKPLPGQLQDLVGRYTAIGGASPLLEITQQQVQGLRDALGAKGSETKVYAGMKHSPPFIAPVVERAVADGVTDLLCIALAPHYSSMSIGGYMKAVEEASSRQGGRLRTEFVRSWHDHPKFISMWANCIEEARTKAGREPWLILSAHSLPERILQQGDPYKTQLLQSSQLVTRQLDWKDWGFAFQSASNTGEKWLGPDILEYLQSLFDEGHRNFLLAPIGFVSEHLEILYDIDVECMNWAEERAASVARCSLPNASGPLVSCLFSLVKGRKFV